MSGIDGFLRAARADAPVWICRVREAFETAGTRPLCLRLRGYDGRLRSWTLKVPPCAADEEARFVEAYLNATVYNLLCALGGQEMTVYTLQEDAALTAWARGLEATFQAGVPIAQRCGWGKCLNVNQRALAALPDVKGRFRFVPGDLRQMPELPPEAPAASLPFDFSAPARRAGQGLWLGMDVGGTDIKAVAAVDGRLCAFREYDWAPAEFTRAEQLIGPILRLARLMRAAACLEASGSADGLKREAFRRTADDQAIDGAIRRMEAALGGALQGFDGIGLSFPDVVIDGRIVGGETPKTRGMRENRALDYESQLARIAGLGECLGAFLRPGGRVEVINDGPMAAFTTAVEEAAAGRDLSEGFFAHTLGTDLGSGWVLPEGAVPPIPLEAYNFVADLGSARQRAFHPDDVRSNLNFTTRLAGTLQKYASQTGVFRLAALTLPRADPALWQGALDRGLMRLEEGRLTVPTTPADMRKPCLEYFMEAAGDPASPAAEIFRQVGEALGAAWRETDFLLSPPCRSRTLYGRLVKQPHCFRLILEGARRVAPDIRLEAADESLANTPLMRQLARHPEYTVAQFGQAVGAIHFACRSGQKER